METKNQLLSSAACIILGMAFQGCAIFDRSPGYVVKGSSGNIKHEREEVSHNGGADDGPVLAPPSQAAAKNKSASSSESGKKAVKNRRKKKWLPGTVSQSELAEARKEAAAEAETVEIPSDGKNSVSSAGELTVKNNIPSDFSIGGEWTVFSVQGKTVTGEERPYITFDLPAKRFYGSNGCNIINGSLVMTARGELAMTDVIATMKMCDDSPFEYLINLAVSDVRSFSARQEGPITFLDLKGEAGNTVMVLRRHNMDFLNGAWKVVSLNGTSLAGNDNDASITINIPDLRIHGTTGCNIFNGELFIDPDKTDSMQFANLATTRKGCPPTSRETEFLLALESVETARAIDTDSVAMYDNGGHELFRLARLNLRQ